MDLRIRSPKAEVHFGSVPEARLQRLLVQKKTSRAQTTKTKICINYRCVTKV